jgi:N-acetylmuramoyl-L-alanine amidase
MLCRRYIMGFSLLLLSLSAQAQNVLVKDVRVAQSAERTRIVLDLNSAAQHKLFSLPNPNRVVVDVYNGKFAAGRLPGGAGLVADVRGADRTDEAGRPYARLVLDLGEAARPKSFVLPPQGEYGHRVVIDLEPFGGTSAPPAVVKSAPSMEGDRDVVVAIDPGHGGKDPGARGRGGLREKDVVLQISRRFAELVDAEPGMKSFLTRTDDRFLHLRERIRRAEKAGADLFISVHADAFSDRRVKGATVYVLSEKGASDEAAALLAKRENESDLIGGVDIADKDDMLASVLVDLSQNASVEASVEVGDLFISEMSRVGKMRKASVQKAGFRVLKSPDIPSLLVETAYISNPQDESNLKSVQYQRRLAQSMHNAVRAYFYTNPPRGSKIARLARNNLYARQHVIQRGDTLSEIAAAYNVSISRIRAENELSGNRIRVGQVLRIPSVGI